MKTRKSKAKQVTHERIVSVAARAIRRSGYGGTGVADIMNESGLTHGGFYAHFASREAMLTEAAEHAAAESITRAKRTIEQAPSGEALQQLAQMYLSSEHCNDTENGCPIAALGSEMPRQAPQVRNATTCQLKELIDAILRQLPEDKTKLPTRKTKPPRSREESPKGKVKLPENKTNDAHDEVLAGLSLMVGALILARAVDDPALSDELRLAALKKLVPRAGQSTAYSSSLTDEANPQRGKKI